jgi:imidazolonepropionase-like amidohydrolase
MNNTNVHDILHDMKKLICLIALGTAGTAVLAQQPVPAKPETKSILFLNGTAHLGIGKVIENSAIGIKDGKIVLVADAATARIESGKFDTTINCMGKQVYPGFIDADCSLGLVESEAVRATTDIADVGQLNPELRSLIAYNTDSKITPVVRINGVLTAQITPRGGIISGTSSVMSLDGWNWEDACYKMDDGVHVNWPTLYTQVPIDEDHVSPPMQSKGYDKQVQMLEKFMSDAKAYSQQKKHDEMDIKLEAMKGIFAGTQTLFIHANYAKEILASVTSAKNLGIQKIVIVGGMEAWRVTDFLKQNNIPVIVRRLHSLPATADDDLDEPYKLPYQLQQAGILFCLENSGDQEQNATRNLPFLAGTASTYGLSKEEAIESITLNAAKILGIDTHIGSLEEGKDATLFVSDGDALDMRTNKVSLAYIGGKKIALTSVQTELYQRYVNKYGLK